MLGMAYPVRGTQSGTSRQNAPASIRVAGSSASLRRCWGLGDLEVCYFRGKVRSSP